MITDVPAVTDVAPLSLIYNLECSKLSQEPVSPTQEQKMK